MVAEGWVDVVVQWFSAPRIFSRFDLEFYSSGSVLERLALGMAGNFDAC